MTRYDCDILVAGGGVSGLPAAVAAARAGARTILVEKRDFLGGAGVVALHRYICGLYVNGPDQPRELLNDGLTAEIAGALSETGEVIPVKLGKTWCLPYRPARMAEFFSELAEREPNLTVLKSATIGRVERDRLRIATIAGQASSGLFEICPRAVIDTTGEGRIIELSGAPYQVAMQPDRQAGGVTLHIDGIASTRELLGLRIGWELLKTDDENDAARIPFGGFAIGPGKEDGFCKFTVPASVPRLGNAEIHKRVIQIFTRLSSSIPELKPASIIAISDVMAREGIRIAGEADLDETAVLSARKCRDAAVRNAWPIEFWAAGGPVDLAYPPDGDYYEIPHGCLRSRAITNLFAAGRCISASSRALASSRVMGCCMALGEAAARAAAEFANSNQTH